MTGRGKQGWKHSQNKIESVLDQTTQITNRGTVLVRTLTVFVGQVLILTSIIVAAFQLPAGVAAPKCSNSVSLIEAADKEFFEKYPERGGKLIDPHEPGFSKLSNEWWDIYESIKQCRESDLNK